MPTQTIVVTGAFGQVGRHVINILLKRRHRVIALDLNTSANEAASSELAQSAIRGSLVSVFVDLLDVEAVNAVLADFQPDAIVHLAAAVSPTSYRNPQRARNINVGGTEAVLSAAKGIANSPFIVFASSAAVYGSRNPYRCPEYITTATPTKPIDHYGQDKVLAEAAVVESGLPYCILRLGGVISPEGTARVDQDHLLLMRAAPSDNRLHTVDCRDVGLAFANAVDRSGAVTGKVLLIGGDRSHLHIQSEIQDDMTQALGLGRLRIYPNLPGDRDNENGWSFTGWFDTSDSQALLEFQQHDWPATLAWISDAHSKLRPVLRLAGPLIRPVIRQVISVQRAYERRRGNFADPWGLVAAAYGPQALASPISPNTGSQQ